MQERLVSCDSRLRKLVMTQFKYITCKDYQQEKMKYGKNITFEEFLEKLELIEGITIIKMTRSVK